MIDRSGKGGVMTVYGYHFLGFKAAEGYAQGVFRHHQGGSEKQGRGFHQGEIMERFTSASRAQRAAGPPTKCQIHDTTEADWRFRYTGYGYLTPTMELRDLRRHR